jgi:hypothetical protein
LGRIGVQNGGHSTRSLAFLCWLDTFERIDTLILEIRHVQETIASQLRVEKLYGPLQYEDHYLWGRYSTSIGRDDEDPSAPEDWFKVLRSPRLPPCSVACTVLAAFWCPEYPPTPDASTFFERLCERDDCKVYADWADIGAHRVCAGLLEDERKRISERNLFSANEDRLYESLRYLQLLKRDILRDKLVLAYRALETFAIPVSKTKESDEGEALAKFLIVRRAVFHSVHQRLDAFRDILSAVQEILNLSIERDPPPTVRRRRDQGIYTTDLADNCRFIERDVRNFFEAVTGNVQTTIDRARLEFIVHRYTRNYTSTYRYEKFWNNALPGESEQQQMGAGFVQSSFWMPERPDLQPIIAHEIAHLYLKSQREELTEPRALDGMNDSLSQLLRRISYIFELYSKRFTYFTFSARTREGLLREIACDLVGIAVHRTSYLFANFLELLCVGGEFLVAAPPDGDVARDIGELGKEYITFIRDRRPEWTVRLSATLAFSNALRLQMNRPAEALEASIHAGMGGVIGAIQRHLSHWMDGEQKEDWLSWLEMTNVVRDLVKEASLVETTSRWQRWRIESSESESMKNWNAPGFNRYLIRLPTSIVEHCVGAWLDRLVEVPRMLGRALDHWKPPPQCVTYQDILKFFRELYLEAQKPIQISLSRRPELELFNHLIDIPWQTAWLTARDFLGAPLDKSSTALVAPLPYDKWIACIHEFNWLGRDLYEFALEYAVWYERPSIGRLKGMNRWLTSIQEAIAALPKPDDQLLATMGTLLRSILHGCGETEQADRRDDEIRQRYGTLIEKWRKEKLQPEDHIGIIGSQAIIRHYPTDDRRTEEILGYNKETLIHFFDFLASAHMNNAGREICRTLRHLLDKEKNPRNVALLCKPAQDVKRPIDPEIPDSEARRQSVRSGRIIVELIRVAHYLDIRPETRPGRRATRHHAGGDDREWDAVFAQYLNVPIQPRKRCDGPKSDEIDGLIPTRSLRVDRFSQLYHVHMSSRAKENGGDVDRYPGHLAENNFIRGRDLNWIPWDEDGVRPKTENGVALVGTTRLGTPLLGRFDRLIIEPAKNTARFKQYAPSMPYFRRQQIGLPFAAAIVGDKIGLAKDHPTMESAFRHIFPKPDRLNNEKASPSAAGQTDQPNGNDAEHTRGKLQVPLATISILLVQRSARLTFVERLLAEELVMKSFHDELSSPYRFFYPTSDIGLLTDGWGDIFLILFGTLDHKVREVSGNFDQFDQYADRCEAVRNRFDEIITLRKSIFEDTLVVRSETSYTPLAIDTALLFPRQFRCTISVRFKATRDGASLAEEFESHLYDVFHQERVVKDENGNEEERKRKLIEILSYSSISGRNDYVITSRQHTDDSLPAKIYKQLCAECDDYSAYGIIFETLRKIFFKPPFIREHVDTTTTTIGELRFPKY